jgi:hypothetical protein
MYYTLLLHAPEAADVDIPADVMAEFQTAFDLFARALDEAGVLVLLDIPQPSGASVTVTSRGGTVEVVDGPFAEPDEKLSGIFVVDVPDRDAAIDWAQRCPGAQYGVMEVRPSALAWRDGAWVSPE